MVSTIGAWIALTSPLFPNSDSACISGYLDGTGRGFILIFSVKYFTFKTFQLLLFHKTLEI